MDDLAAARRLDFTVQIDGELPDLLSQSKKACDADRGKLALLDGFGKRFLKAGGQLIQTGLHRPGRLAILGEFGE
jgi:hypothetical protein